MGEKRSGAPEVCDLQTDLTAALERARVDEVDNGTRRVEHELVEPDRMLRQRRWGRRGSRMQEHVCAARIERIPHWGKALIAVVDPADVGQQRDPVELQHVERVVELRDRGVRVRERQHGEAGEPRRIGAHERRGLLVDEPRQVDRERSVAEPHPGRRQGHDGGVDRVAIHQRIHLPCRPRGQRQRQQAPLLERAPVVIRDDVGMGVDPHRRQSGRMPTTRAGAALARTRRSGKHATVAPVEGI